MKHVIKKIGFIYLMFDKLFYNAGVTYATSDVNGL